MSAFHLTEREVGPLQRLVGVHGELGLPDVDRLQAALEAAADEGCGVVVGLEDCTFIDSIALAALLRGRDRLAEKGRRLVIAGPTGQVRRILDVTGLDLDGFLFYSVEQALSES